MSTTDATSARRTPLLNTTDLALIAAFAALIAVCTYIGAIPVGGAGVPITLQTLAVVLAGCILGPARGALAALLYLGLGLIGLPVFAQHSAGFGVLVGATGGYLLSYPFAAALSGALTKYVLGPVRKSRALWVFFAALAASALVIHPFGLVWLKYHQDLPWDAAFMAASVPFLLGDLMKTLIVALVAAEVHRAFPQLLHPRR